MRHTRHAARGTRHTQICAVQIHTVRKLRIFDIFPIKVYNQYMSIIIMIHHKWFTISIV